MSAPPKPWEVAGTNSRSLNGVPGVQNITDSNRLLSSNPSAANPSILNGVPTNMRMYPSAPIAAPALPPRPRQITRQSYIPSAGYNTPYSYGSYGTGYGGYTGMGGYYGSSYGGFGSYGGYGMNRFGYNNNLTGNDPESRFIQMAEENSRPAFQSIESLVHAFGSVSFMLESTFNAIYSSFRAVLSVAENFGRLRTMFGQFFSTFAILRTLQWLYRKLLYLIGLRKINPEREAIWQQVAAGGNLPPEVNAENVRSSWPIIMFMGILMSGPYLVWKLVSSLSNSQTPNPYDLKDWKKSKDPVYVAVALYNFAAESNQELSFRAGQKLLVAPKDLQPRDIRGWMLATTTNSNGSNKIGLVPYNYIRFATVTNAPQQNNQGNMGPRRTTDVSQNHASAMNAQTAVPDTYIPTVNSHPATAPIMQTGWVPQPIAPVTTGWVPQASEPVTEIGWDPQAIIENPVQSVKEPEEKPDSQGTS